MGSGQNNKPAGTDRLIGEDQGDNGIDKFDSSGEKVKRSGTADTTGKQVDERSRKDLAK
ncbi:hypothetical protein ACLSU7_01065 [Bdellovibrio sp. HCB185ZH]|uniref:hypothetical protein n=1 Tax=Bdellovibrio sp. HCB185ZH TaxID=3394235 RepID=UPI0039A5F133